MPDTVDWWGVVLHVENGRGFDHIITDERGAELARVYGYPDTFPLAQAMAAAPQMVHLLKTWIGRGLTDLEMYDAARDLLRRAGLVDKRVEVRRGPFPP